MAVRLCQSEYRALSFWLNSTSAWPATLCLAPSAFGVKGSPRAHQEVTRRAEGVAG